MHKLSAKLPKGRFFVTNSKTINDLHRIADGLGASSYSISLNGSVVYEIDHLTVYVQGV